MFTNYDYWEKFDDVNAQNEIDKNDVVEKFEEDQLKSEMSAVRKHRALQEITRCNVEALRSKVRLIRIIFNYFWYNTLKLLSTGSKDCCRVLESKGNCDQKAKFEKCNL